MTAGHSASSQVLAALAHLSPGDLWRSWSLAPLPSILLAGAVYAVGLTRLGDRASCKRTVAFYTGLSVAGLALVSPLHALGEMLFAAHMVQHLLLMLVAAPLIVSGAAGVVLASGLPADLRRSVMSGRPARTLRAAARKAVHPAVTWPLHAVVLWMWHVPWAYDLALNHAVIHALEHATLLGVAMLFWWPVLHPVARRRMDRGLATLYVFGAAVMGGVFGALMAFSATPWYDAHLLGSAAWGLTAVQDQQLAGMIMWVPGGIVYATFAVWLLGVWLSESSRRAWQPGA